MFEYSFSVRRSTLLLAVMFSISFHLNSSSQLYSIVMFSVFLPFNLLKEYQYGASWPMPTKIHKYSIFQSIEFLSVEMKCQCLKKIYIAYSKDYMRIEMSLTNRLCFLSLMIK